MGLRRLISRRASTPPIRDLRDLTRYRKALIEDRAREANRHKVLQDAGIRLSNVATDLLGVSGRARLEALVQGTTDPTVLADLARGNLRRKLPALRAALAGRFRPHHALVVTAYHVLARQCDYRELGADYLDRQSAARNQPRAVRALERLGDRVTLETAA